MVRRVTSREFIEWLDKQLDTYHWNDSQASKLAGLDKSAISAIRNGINPGPKRCIALARLFNRPESEVLELAGHLPQVEPSPLTDIAGLQEIAEALAKLPPDAQRRVVNAVLALVQVQEVVSKTAILRQPAESERNAT